MYPSFFASPRVKLLAWVSVQAFQASVTEKTVAKYVQKSILTIVA